MKIFKLNIFAKTVIISAIMLCIITMISYLLVYTLLPEFYKSYKTDQYHQKAKGFLSQLEQTTSIEEEKILLTKFVQDTSAALKVTNEDKTIFFQLSLANSVLLTETNDALVLDSDLNEQREQSVEVIEDSESVDLQLTYFANGHPRNMDIIVNLQPLNEAKEVLIRIYPIAGLLSILFSFILATLFSRSFVKPIRYIRNVTSKMITLDPAANIETRSKDELGALSQDINLLYKELRGTISELEKEIKVFSDSENQKIDFLRTVSHELKTPLASANALIEGIIYEVPPYCEDSKKYLGECKTFLDKAIYLTKESLSLSPGYHEEEQEYHLKSIVQKIYSSYRVILKSKQILYIENIPEDLVLSTKVKMFSNALSNIFSNAANYTTPHGVLKIEYLETENQLIIENTCQPLTEEELRRVFLPFSSGNQSNSLSNGLGLYIVNQIFRLLKIEYSFLPAADGCGMKFVISLHS